MIACLSIMVALFYCTIIHPKESLSIDFAHPEKIHLISSREDRNSFISYIEIDGTTYLLKQKKDFNKQISVVKDKLAEELAKGLGVTHRVAIVPHDKNIPGKVKSMLPATIHTLAGSTVRSQKNCKYHCIRIRQFWAGVADINKRGLTPTIIRDMSVHKQLAIIVALDLITGNSDRHCGNICYNPETDTFCAIDMDDTFNKDLCYVACEKIKLMLNDPVVVFTKEEIQGLRIMRTTLKFLVQKHKPKKVIAKMHAFAKQAGFKKGNKLYNDKIKRKLLLYEQTYQATYKSAQRLIDLLDLIIDHKSRPVIPRRR
jgi:hypothetical protein